jgi:cytochrome c
MNTLTLSVMAVFVSLASTSSVLAQDVAAGENSFKKCLVCHSLGEGAKNKVGPELNGLDGRKSGSVEGFSYSDGNKNSGITWNKEQFLDYIKTPRRQFREPRWCSPASRTRRKPTISGPTSRNSIRTEGRSSTILNPQRKTDRTVLLTGNAFGSPVAHRLDRHKSSLACDHRAHAERSAQHLPLLQTAAGAWSQLR